MFSASVTQLADVVVMVDSTIDPIEDDAEEQQEHQVGADPDDELAAGRTAAVDQSEGLAQRLHETDTCIDAGSRG